MYPFTKTFSTTKFTKWLSNTCSYIIIHHTATPWFESNVKYLSEWNAQVSVHFVIWPNEEVAKIGDPKMITWHCWVSSWGSLTNMNKYSLWIEVVWTWQYNTKQLIRLTDLVEYLIKIYNIPKENILTHADICQKWDFSKKKILWDWKRASRKVDIAKSFFPMWFETWRDQLTPRAESRYWSI